MGNFGKGKWVKVRKDKACSWCGETIKKGEKAYHFNGRWDGDWQDWKMHEECRQANIDEENYGGDGFFYPYENERPKIQENK